MADGTYDTIAAVYDHLVPDALLSPRGSADAFAPYVAPGARVLDCACGTGTLAVGLALRGHEVVATDASAAMVARTQRLAAANGARVDASVCRWEALPERGWREAFDVVLCVGNSLPHAVGRRGLPIYAWTIPAAWDAEHCFDVAVAFAAPDGQVTTFRERFVFWPFTQDELRQDLRDAGLEPEGEAVAADKAGRYLMTARRPG